MNFCRQWTQFIVEVISKVSVKKSIQFLLVYFPINICFGCMLPMGQISFFTHHKHEVSQSLLVFSWKYTLIINFTYIHTYIHVYIWLPYVIEAYHVYLCVGSCVCVSMCVYTYICRSVCNPLGYCYARRMCVLRKLNISFSNFLWFYFSYHIV